MHAGHQYDRSTTCYVFEHIPLRDAQYGRSLSIICVDGGLVRAHFWTRYPRPVNRFGESLPQMPNVHSARDEVRELLLMCEPLLTCFSNAKSPVMSEVGTALSGLRKSS